jgi:anti-sigma B factor antagonist
MTLQSRTVSVKQLPETIDVKQQRNLMRELESCLNAGRPCIVIDCSKLQYIDRSTLFLLLRCLEEAMKRHGDVRLATIPRQGQSLFMATNIDRLFRIFDHVTDAVNSYGRVNALGVESSHGGMQRISADAA